MNEDRFYICYIANKKEIRGCVFYTADNAIAVYDNMIKTKQYKPKRGKNIIAIYDKDGNRIYG